jgi:hypothetical protein
VADHFDGEQLPVDSLKGAAGADALDAEAHDSQESRFGDKKDEETGRHRVADGKQQHPKPDEHQEQNQAGADEGARLASRLVQGRLFDC